MAVKKTKKTGQKPGELNREVSRPWGVGLKVPRCKAPRSKGYTPIRGALSMKFYAYLICAKSMPVPAIPAKTGILGHTAGFPPAWE